MGCRQFRLERVLWPGTYYHPPQPSELIYDGRLMEMEVGPLEESPPFRYATEFFYISDEDIAEIRRLCAAGEKQRDIAERMGIPQTSVSIIHRNVLEREQPDREEPVLAGAWGPDGGPLSVRWSRRTRGRSSSR